MAEVETVLSAGCAEEETKEKEEADCSIGREFVGGLSGVCRRERG